MAQPFSAWYFEVPIVTRTYATVVALTSLACNLGVVSPYQLYFNLDLIIYKHQLWRLATNFVYFGKFGLDFFFNVYFLVRYCRSLEEGIFRGRTADFVFLLLFGATLMTLIGPFVNILFLGSALTFMLVYVWGARNPHVRMSFLGLFTFTAPYLPWVLLGFSLLLHNSPVTDLLGIAVGHVYFFLDYEYPRKTGRHLLRTPSFFVWLIEGGGPPEEEDVSDTEDDDPNFRAPGGFEWGEGRRLGEDAAQPL